MQAVTSEPVGLLAQFLPSMADQHLNLPPETRLLPETEFHVAIMEASDSLARLIATGLKAESLAVDLASRLEDLHSMLRKRISNLLILDLDFPELDGLAMLGDFRSRYPGLAILALSGRRDVDGLVSALHHGADDYLPKPFSLIELLARVRALRRRTFARVDKPVVRACSLVLDRDQCQVERDGRIIALTPREYALFEFLVENSGKILSRVQLTQAVWNTSSETNTNIVDVYIKYLRDKLDGEHDHKLIRTVRGMGYIFQPQS